MSSDRDRLWADMIQFDHDLADRALDGQVTDPEAPPWYRDLRSMIHRARGPAEADELVDEALMVDTMRRVTLGARVAGLPRRKGVRRVAQVVGIKAAAAVTTISLTSVAAAAATGLVATVAATVVVPVINERVMPIIEDGLTPAATRPAQSPSRSGGQSRTPPTCERTDGRACGEWDEDVASATAAPVPGPITPTTLPAAEPIAGSTGDVPSSTATTVASGASDATTVAAGEPAITGDATMPAEGSGGTVGDSQPAEVAPAEPATTLPAPMAADAPPSTEPVPPPTPAVTDPAPASPPPAATPGPTPLPA
ncbi:MAG TPA: hypothetical protein VFY82_13605, partial [Acidimicrobiales bacterium]|nr:hypothetical protein [Acidimicrobiales bacterium]